METPGLERAETDFAGDYLRLTLADARAQSAAIELLAASGYPAEAVTETPADRWYDRASVGELSRVEAGVIAERVITRLRSTRPIDDPTAQALRGAVVGALHRCFTATALTAQPSPGLRARAVGATRQAATAIVGAVVAAELARLVEEDMAEDHKQRDEIIRP